jgi:transcription initiation factor TFIID subunit
MLDDYEPLVCIFNRLRSQVLNSPYGIKIPDEVTEYYLQRVGFDCQDARL